LTLRSAFTIRQTLSKGTSLTVSAKDYCGFEIATFARYALEGGATLTILDSDQISDIDLRRISRYGGKHVILN
jgi:hypothetical protein